mmetsp:Transcript_158372/g.507966  ORF Transcript_158372/g.507966 Transcript_158372/m.507966 type:complete len:297 (+) Transcript_158372:958-1848(+)
MRGKLVSGSGEERLRSKLLFINGNRRCRCTRKRRRLWGLLATRARARGCRLPQPARLRLRLRHVDEGGFWRERRRLRLGLRGAGLRSGRRRRRLTLLRVASAPLCDNLLRAHLRPLAPSATAANRASAAAPPALAATATAHATTAHTKDENREEDEGDDRRAGEHHNKVEEGKGIQIGVDLLVSLFPPVDGRVDSRGAQSPPDGRGPRRGLGRAAQACRGGLFLRRRLRHAEEAAGAEPGAVQSGPRGLAEPLIVLLPRRHLDNSALRRALPNCRELSGTGEGDEEEHEQRAEARL